MSNTTAPDQTHAPWCDPGSPMDECEASRLNWGYDEGECWSHANDDGSADRAYEKWLNAWG